MARPVFIIDGSRTPFLKARSGPGPFTPVDLAVQCGRPLLARQPFAPDAFDQVILGCVNVIADEMNPARVAAVRLGMGEAMVAFTVQINCGSGMQSIDTAYGYIREGVSDLILAGGSEALSYAPLVWPQQGVRWFAGLAGAKGILGKIAAIAKARPAYFKPIMGLDRGRPDPITELNMGQTAEVVGHLLGVTRAQSDAYAAESHKRLANAQTQGWLKGEVETAFGRDGKFYDHDDGVRPDSTPETLAKLKPVFERPWGKVTAGNSSQITDGASWVILASEQAGAKHGLTPKAVILDSQWSALDPGIMGLGPVLSATELLKRNSLTLQDIETWELNEAFATQVLGCLAAWKDEKFCKEILGLEGAAGEIDQSKMNVDGGAISLGHPVGCSGNRIVLHLVNAMKRLGTRRGIATECIGGGQGGAMQTQISRAHAVIDRMEALRIPTVAVIHGFCLGGGLEVALACQMRIAIDDARFGFPEVMLGLHPGLGGTVRFTHLVNPMQAMPLMLTGKTIDARKARSLGLVDAVTQERPVRHSGKHAMSCQLTRA